MGSQKEYIPKFRPDPGLKRMGKSGRSFAQPLRLTLPSGLHPVQKPAGRITAADSPLLPGWIKSWPKVAGLV